MNNNSTFQNSTRRIALSGLLVSLMLILGYVESLIPINAGIPGIKLGLSNSVLIFGLYMLDIPTTFIMMLLKVVLSGALFGSVSTMMYAAAGGVLSVTGMALLSRVKGLHIVTVSMMGGALHNIGQVALAMLLLGARSLVFYMAVLMLVGMGCGLLTGLCANSVLHSLKVIDRASGHHV